MNKRKLFLQRLLLLIEKNINYKQNKFRSYKPNKGYTSELDIKVNNFLFKSIKEYFPNDTIISEESLKINEIQKNYSECNIWIIDPICGTTNQVRQIPIFANSVSILQKNNDIAAGIYDVNRSELFFTDGKRTTLNGKKVNTSKVKKLGDAVISINCNQSSNKINRNKIENIIKKIAPPITRRIKIFESANLEMAYVASGRIDAYINPDDKLWDIFAGAHLIKNSGGRHYIIKGSIRNPFSSIKGVIASNKYIHGKLLDIFSNIK